jgi:hypothetical protein
MNPAARSVTVMSNAHATVAVEQSNQDLIVRVVGKLNEDVNLNDVGLFLDAIPDIQTVGFDLSRLLEINSCGVREWVLFMEKVTSRFRCRIVAASEIFVAQASIVPGVLGRERVPVESFQAPYFCPPCNRTESRVLKPGDVLRVAGGIEPPAAPCGTCAGPLEFDALADEYFSFLFTPRR